MNCIHITSVNGLNFNKVSELLVIFIINDQGLQRLHTWPWLLFQIFTSIQFQLQKAIIMMRINLTIFALIVFGSVEPRYLDNTTEKSDVSLHIF